MRLIASGIPNPRIWLANYTRRFYTSKFAFTLSYNLQWYQISCVKLFQFSNFAKKKIFFRTQNKIP